MPEKAQLNSEEKALWVAFWQGMMDLAYAAQAIVLLPPPDEITIALEPIRLAVEAMSEVWDEVYGMDALKGDPPITF